MPDEKECRFATPNAGSARISTTIRRNGLFALALLWSALGCNSPDQPESPGTASGPKTVYTVNYPLAYFAREIAGDAVRVEFPCPPGEDPAFRQPDDETLLKFQQADLILLNGADYAKWIKSASLPERVLLNTSEEFRKDLIEEKDAVVHQHGPDGEHSHGALAFTTWLDPNQAILHAKAITNGLSELSPGDAKKFQTGFDVLKANLSMLNTQLDDAVAHYDKQPLLASHPVYQYLARRCGWNLKSLHWEPDVTPGEEELEKLDALLKQHAAGWMIWEDEPTPETRELLSKRNIECVVFRPCGNAPAEGDYLSVMKENIENLKPVFESLAGQK